MTKTPLWVESRLPTDLGSEVLTLTCDWGGHAQAVCAPASQAGGEAVPCVEQTAPDLAPDLEPGREKVMLQLPQKRTEVIQVDLEGEQLHLYDSLVDRLVQAAI